MYVLHPSYVYIKIANAMNPAPQRDYVPGFESEPSPSNTSREWRLPRLSVSHVTHNPPACEVFLELCSRGVITST